MFTPSQMLGAVPSVPTHKTHTNRGSCSNNRRILAKIPTSKVLPISIRESVGMCLYLCICLYLKKFSLKIKRNSTDNCWVRFYCTRQSSWRKSIFDLINIRKENKKKKILSGKRWMIWHERFNNYLQFQIKIGFTNPKFKYWW